MEQNLRKISNIKFPSVKKESKETKHWLRMIAKANPNRKDQCKNCGRRLKNLL